jgi:hypothetical protein
MRFRRRDLSAVGAVLLSAGVREIPVDNEPWVVRMIDLVASVRRAATWENAHA